MFKTKQSVSDHFHFQAETDGKFKAQYKHSVHFLSGSKIKKSKLSYTLKGKTIPLYNISSESLKIVKFMDVKRQVLCIYREYLVKNFNILVQEFSNPFCMFK